MGYFNNIYLNLKSKNYPWLAILLLVYIFSLPFSKYIPRMPFFPFISVTVFVKSLILIVLLMEIILNKRKLIEYNQYLFLIFLILIVLFSTFWAENIIFSFNRIWELFHLFILYFLITQIIDTKRLLKWTIIILILSGFIVSLLGIWQYIFDPTRRVTSLIGDPNIFATLLIFCIPLNFYLIKIYKNFRKLILFLIFVFLIFIFFLTISRGGLIALLSVLFLILLKERRKISLLGLFFLIFLICLPLLPSNFWLRQGTIFGLVKDPQMLGSVSQRAEILVSGLKMFFDNFLFGVGIGNFGVELPESLVHAPFFYGSLNKAAHNTFLEIAVELGVFGLLIFLVLIWDSFRILISSKVKFSQDKEIVCIIDGLNISLIGILIAGLFLSIGWNLQLWLLLSIITTFKKLKINKR